MRLVGRFSDFPAGQVLPAKWTLESFILRTRNRRRPGRTFHARRRSGIFQRQAGILTRSRKRRKGAVEKGLAIFPSFVY